MSNLTWLLLESYRNRNIAWRVCLDFNLVASVELASVTDCDLINGLADQDSNGNLFGYFSRMPLKDMPNVADYDADFNLIIEGRIVGDMNGPVKISLDHTFRKRTMHAKADGNEISTVEDRRFFFSELYRNYAYKGMLEDAPASLLQLMEELVLEKRHSWVTQ